MTFLKYHYKNIISYDLILQKFIKNYYLLPYLSNINLNFGIKHQNLNKKEEHLVFFFFVLRILTNQNPKLVPLKKKDIITLKLQKDNNLSCKLDLRNKKMYDFLNKIVCISQYLNLKIQKNQSNNFNFQIKKFLNFLELKSEFVDLYYINPIINVNCKINNLKNDKTILFLKNFNILFLK